jgi:hypothetical protein
MCVVDQRTFKTRLEQLHLRGIGVAGRVCHSTGYRLNAGELGYIAPHPHSHLLAALMANVSIPTSAFLRIPNATEQIPRLAILEET